MIKKNTVLRSQFTDYSLIKTLFYFIMFYVLELYEERVDT